MAVTQLRVFVLSLLVVASNINLAAAQEDCALPQFSQHGLAYDNRGRPLISVGFGNLNETMLLDTGSALSALEMDQVLQLNLPQFDAGLTMTVVTGETSSLATIAENFSLGSIKRDEMMFMILPGFDYRLSANEPVGFLALDFFSSFDLELDFRNDDVRLFLPKDCSDPVSRWGNENTIEIPFDGINAEFISIAILLDDVEVQAIIDTGAAYSVLNIDTASQRLGIDVTKPDERMIRMDRTDFIRTYEWQFSELNIGGIIFENPQITLFPNLVRGQGRTNLDGEPLSLSDMIIGMDILRDLHLYFSFAEGKIYASGEECAVAQ